jgi:hypothetical protein
MYYSIKKAVHTILSHISGLFHKIFTQKSSLVHAGTTKTTPNTLIKKKKAQNPKISHLAPNDFFSVLRPRKGLGNEGFPNRNPQPEFISGKEKPKFQSC